MEAKTVGVFGLTDDADIIEWVRQYADAVAILEDSDEWCGGLILTNRNKVGVNVKHYVSKTEVEVLEKVVERVLHLSSKVSEQLRIFHRYVVDCISPPDAEWMKRYLQRTDVLRIGKAKIMKIRELLSRREKERISGPQLKSLNKQILCLQTLKEPSSLSLSRSVVFSSGGELHGGASTETKVKTEECNCYCYCYGGPAYQRPDAAHWTRGWTSDEKCLVSLLSPPPSSLSSLLKLPHGALHLKKIQQSKTGRGRRVPSESAGRGSACSKLSSGGGVQVVGVQPNTTLVEKKRKQYEDLVAQISGLNAARGADKLQILQIQKEENEVLSGIPKRDNFPEGSEGKEAYASELASWAEKKEAFNAGKADRDTLVATL
uniref:Uncharacterized protein n=1 Tax=Chromera velia CCMP2878 TaxID=1169474 RepID=A0A0G4FS79_9ALVE|eukprot:Cvel_18352.t1-p1 / transcript=Cvel_18352.t1 / gene=Cvel_18352 / organism=Chromera_velia_CCMP2878 / gene_product=hypothetical protein / transcript_product=hypothetical protein / location=Cvel_scaffold1516:27953-29074(+) / protein_length=374 / sequence_SO=supercontig / SO=protein_coding / is_pseudo=false